MAKFKVNKRGTEQLILTGNEIVLVESLMNIVRLGHTPLKEAAASILTACSEYEYVAQQCASNVKLGVTISKPITPGDHFGPEFEQKFSEFEPNTYLTIETENQ